MENNNELPKYKIGETVFANWAGGHITKHIITDITKTYHGFWYSWKDAINDFGNGLHECYLSHFKNKKKSSYKSYSFLF